MAKPATKTYLSTNKRKQLDRRAKRKAREVPSSNDDPYTFWCDRSSITNTPTKTSQKKPVPEKNQHDTIRKSKMCNSTVQSCKKRANNIKIGPLLSKHTPMPVSSSITLKEINMNIVPPHSTHPNHAPAQPNSSTTTSPRTTSASARLNHPASGIRTPTGPPSLFPSNPSVRKRKRINETPGTDTHAGSNGNAEGFQSPNSKRRRLIRWQSTTSVRDQTVREPDEPILVDLRYIPPIIYQTPNPPTQIPSSQPVPHYSTSSKRSTDQMPETALSVFDFLSVVTPNTTRPKAATRWDRGSKNDTNVIGEGKKTRKQKQKQKLWGRIQVENEIEGGESDDKYVEEEDVENINANPNDELYDTTRRRTRRGRKVIRYTDSESESEPIAKKVCSKNKCNTDTTVSSIASPIVHSTRLRQATPISTWPGPLPISTRTRSKFKFNPKPNVLRLISPRTPQDPSPSCSDSISVVCETPLLGYGAYSSSSELGCAPSDPISSAFSSQTTQAASLQADVTPSASGPMFTLSQIRRAFVVGGAEGKKNSGENGRGGVKSTERAGKTREIERARTRRQWEALEAEFLRPEESERSSGPGVDESGKCNAWSCGILVQDDATLKAKAANAWADCSDPIKSPSLPSIPDCGGMFVLSCADRTLVECGDYADEGGVSWKYEVSGGEKGVDGGSHVEENVDRSRRLSDVDEEGQNYGSDVIGNKIDFEDSDLEDHADSVVDLNYNSGQEYHGESDAEVGVDCIYGLKFIDGEGGGSDVEERADSVCGSTFIKDKEGARENNVKECVNGSNALSQRSDSSTLVAYSLLSVVAKPDPQAQPPPPHITTLFSTESPHLNITPFESPQLPDCPTSPDLFTSPIDGDDPANATSQSFDFPFHNPIRPPPIQTLPQQPSTAYGMKRLSEYAIPKLSTATSNSSSAAFVESQAVGKRLLLELVDCNGDLYLCSTSRTQPLQDALQV
ncbi:hypothetical protein BC938DRAFT_478301 [Jimgerdemannia flammicorona]|uniref:Uncharacterized protein n=1 Tax=Jimgerdemannia flammicorona TaxID=994334 RepID=A0A433R0N6_9FUNG|nr:hypothetical protein BC938DRAFT_478301 [Jimgerdemannia flammicorona]